MYYLNNYVKLGKRPREIVDKNLSTNAEKLKNLMLIKTPEENSVQIKNLRKYVVVFVGLEEFYVEEVKNKKK